MRANRLTFGLAVLRVSESVLQCMAAESCFKGLRTQASLCACRACAAAVDIVSTRRRNLDEGSGSLETWVVTTVAMHGLGIQKAV